MALSFRNEVIKSVDGRIKFWRKQGSKREQWHLSVWAEGTESELDAIEHVEYLLHPTFKNRLRKSTNRQEKFGITFWTWGIFEIKITVFFKSGEQREFDYFLKYQLPDDDGTNYVQIEF